MSGRQSDARAHRRAMQKAGVAVAVRVEVREDATDYGVRVRAAVSEALRGLEAQGGDLHSRVAITVGSDHPNFPGKTIVEAKASEAVKPVPPRVPEGEALVFAEVNDGNPVRIPVDPDRDDAGQ